jgi:hypothetical protein
VGGTEDAVALELSLSEDQQTAQIVGIEIADRV